MRGSSFWYTYTMTQQLCIIHGGTVFNTKQDYLDYLAAKTPTYDRLLYSPDWKPWLAQQLPDFDVLMPSMPSKSNAEYEEWALWFSKIIPFLQPNAILVGHSLGGIFLAKYLCEHPPATPYAKLLLLAAPYNDETSESLRGFTRADYRALSSVAHEVHLLASTDDPVVPYAETLKYHHDLPGATLHRFHAYGHFNQSEFPELLQIIRS